MDKIKTGMYAKNVIFGLGLAVAGIALTTILHFSNMTIAISRIRLPQWSIYVVGGIFVIVGILLIISALKEDLCIQCNAKIKDIELAISPKHKDILMNAIHGKEEMPFKNLTILDDSANALILNISFCEKCANFAKISLKENVNYSSEILVEDTYINEKQVKYYIDFAYSHETEEE